MHVNLKSQRVRVGLRSQVPIRQAGICSVFEDHASVSIVCGELDALLEDPQLRFVILDLSCEPDWFSVQRMVSGARPDLRQIVVAPVGDDEMVLRALRGGVRGFLDANSGPLAVRQAVESVIQGTIWAPRRVLSSLVDQLLSQPSTISPSEVAPTFSRRERQVLDLIMTACSNREIAEELGIEERTVKAYVASLMRKTGVDNRVSLSVRATRNSFRDLRGMAP